jgi:hypothetical protein
LVEGRTRLEGVSEQVLRRIFRPKREEVAGSWRTLHNEETFTDYYYGDYIKEMGKACTTNGRHEKCV